MRSSAKQAESEFDDLLGQLTDELAMTPASDSAVALVPDLAPPKVHVESTGRMAAEAAAAAGVLQPQVISKPDNTLVKVVGIIAASLTVVSVAALIMFGQAKPAVEPAPVADDAAMAKAEREATEREAAERRAEQEARELAMQAERVADQVEHARIEAARLAAQLPAKVEESKPKPRTKPKPKPKPKPNPGEDFDAL
jgi:pyruvate/2-oxoglutarate dehydrogenase complex dihydrolipoamide acyltransferase (E2) component